MPQLSAEVRAIIAFMGASGVPHRIASTYRLTATRHGWPGTDGWGLAVDVAGPRPGRDTPELKAVFDAFWLVRRQLRELYYSGPGVTHNIRHAVSVRLSDIPQSIRNGHHDHIHASVLKGTFIKWPGATIATPEEAMATGLFVDWCFARNAIANDKGRFPFYAVTAKGEVFNFNMPDGYGIKGLPERAIKLAAPVFGVEMDPQGSTAIVLVAEDGGTFKIGP